MSSDHRPPAPTGVISVYHSLGLEMTQRPQLARVQPGDHMINVHRPELGQGDVTLRAAAAIHPWLVGRGSSGAQSTMLTGTGADIIEGPVEREGGRGTPASSVYVRDPDGNLIEPMTYPDESKEHARVS